jgi:hypothetical protein
MLNISVDVGIIHTAMISHEYFKYFYYVVSFKPLSLYPRRKSPRFPFDRRFGGPQSRYGRSGEEKILDPTRIRTPTPLSFSP